VEHLIGMFAFALWDNRKRQLLIARDRLGERPLFYTRAGDRLLFASEIKALLQDPAVSRELNPTALTHYLTALYIPYPQSIFQHIHKLPPGHFMLVNEHGLRIERYWHPERVQPRALSLDEAVEELRPMLADAVRLQMRSDVPVGAFLSAGMDSTSIVANAVRTTAGAHMKTFAVGFDGAEWDERAGARQVAEIYGTEHYDVTLTYDDVWQLLPKTVWLLDEPMADGSTVPLLKVATLARQHVKVVLAGAGGDELFAGYPRYGYGQQPPLRRMLQALPHPIKEMAERVGNLYSPGFGHRVRVTLRDIEREYYEDRMWFNAEQRQTLTGRNGSPYAEVVAHHYRRWTNTDAVNRLMYVDMHTYLSDDLLPMTDRTALGVSLEGRVPFLDHRLVEWAMALPGDLKLRNGVSKYVLRKAMEPLLPMDILNRPKRGFGPPFGAWLRNGLLEFTRQLLLSPQAQARGLYNPDLVKPLLSGNLSDHRLTQQIWTLLVLEIWFRIFVDNGNVASAPGNLRDLL
jgi:asparagine synthase (glutamine-hydrolysing)